MKRVAIFLRKNLAENKFRDVILSALRSDEIDSALLSSGFFQEDASYSVSNLFRISPHRLCKPLALTIVGLYSYSDKKKYTTFINNIKAYNCSLCFQLTSKVMSGMRWHAKVFIAKKDGNPAIAIIGSSNITRRAFDTLTNFNYECDVVFWDETNTIINQIINNIISEGDNTDNSSSIIVTNYDDGHPANRQPLTNRLLQLESEILSGLNDFVE